MSPLILRRYFVPLYTWDSSSTCLYGSLEGLPWKIENILITWESILKCVPLFRGA